MNISIVIPIKADDPSTHLFGHLEQNLHQWRDHGDANIEIIVVDSSRSDLQESVIKPYCSRFNARYIYQDNPTPYQPGIARDLGVQIARHPYILIFDADLIADAAFIQETLPKSLADVSASPCFYAFDLFPCLYTKPAAKSLPHTQDTFDHIKRDYLAGRSQYVESPAIVTSIMLFRREAYLALGGHDKGFSGHGFEDFDLLHRFAAEYPISPRPDNYFELSRHRIVAEYAGFRDYMSQYSLEKLTQPGVVLHQWHTRSKRKLTHYRKVRQNLSRFKANMSDYLKSGQSPKPLQKIDTNSKHYKNIAVMQQSLEYPLREWSARFHIEACFHSLDSAVNDKSVDENTIIHIFDHDAASTKNRLVYWNISNENARYVFEASDQSMATKQNYRATKRYFDDKQTWYWRFGASDPIAGKDSTRLDEAGYPKPINKRFYSTKKRLDGLKAIKGLKDDKIRGCYQYISVQKSLMHKILKLRRKLFRRH